MPTLSEVLISEWNDLFRKFVWIVSLLNELVKRQIQSSIHISTSAFIE